MLPLHPVQVVQPPPQRVRARERRLVALPEPGLYERFQLTISDIEGDEHVAQRCPIALKRTRASACHIVRQGTLTKHGVIGPGFPVALTGVARLRCLTHARTFNMLHPLVHEDLPASVIVQPEVVALTDNLVLLREAYEDLAMQVDYSIPCAVSFAADIFLIGLTPILLLSCLLGLRKNARAGSGQRECPSGRHSVPRKMPHCLETVPREVSAMGPSHSP